MNKLITYEQKQRFLSIERLQLFIGSDTLTPSETVQLKEMTKKQKEKLVSEIYFKNKRRKEFYTCKDGRIKSYAPQFIANTREELVEKL